MSEQFESPRKIAALNGAVEARRNANQLRIMAAEYRIWHLNALEAAQRADQRASDYEADAELAMRWEKFGHPLARRA